MTHPTPGRCGWRSGRTGRRKEGDPNPEQKSVSCELEKGALVESGFRTPCVWFVIKGLGGIATLQDNKFCTKLFNRQLSSTSIVKKTSYFIRNSSTRVITDVKTLVYEDTSDIRSGRRSYIKSSRQY